MVRHGFVIPPRPSRPSTAPPRVRRAQGQARPEAASLSGGNLQKFIVGREILRNPVVLVVSQPTWGVDAGAAAVIRQALLDLAAAGAAVLVTTRIWMNSRNHRPHRGDVSRAAVGAAANRASQSRKTRLLMGGSALAQKEPLHAVGA